jgi:hypothetical protein
MRRAGRFDGVNPHIAGARRGGSTIACSAIGGYPGFTNLAPFADDDQAGPVTGERDGLLHRQRALGGVPRIITTNTSPEYWHSAASLIHTDLAGGHDLEPGPDARIYLFAGTPHAPAALPLASRNPLDGSTGSHPFNVVDYTPLLRAALVNLERWVTAGTRRRAASRLADCTRPLERIADVFSTIPAARRSNLSAYPTGAGMTSAPTPPASALSRSSGAHPVRAGCRRRWQRAGRYSPPQVAAPTATYTGWNAAPSTTGAIGEMI